MELLTFSQFVLLSPPKLAFVAVGHLMIGGFLFAHFFGKKGASGTPCHAPFHFLSFASLTS
jgi:hypothetical protein